MAVFLLAFLGLPRIQLEPVGQVIIEELNPTQLGPRGGFLAAARGMLYHWNSDGSLKLSIRMIDPALDFIHSFHFDGSHYLVGEIADGIFRMHAFDATGRQVAFLEGAESFVPDFMDLGSELLAQRNIGTPQLSDDPFYFMANSFKYRVSEDDLQIKLTPLLGKINVIQQHFAYNFKKIWVAKRAEVYYVVNQLEPKVYRYTKASIQKEKQDGTKFASSIPFNRLALPKHTRSPDGYFSLKKPIHKSKYMELLSLWWYSWSQITWFGRFKEGFAVSYWIPGHDSGPFCIPLGIQKFNASFEPIGDLTITTGIMLGVREGLFHVFQPGVSHEADGSEKGMMPCVVSFD